MTNLLQGTGFFDGTFWGGYRAVGLSDFDQYHSMTQIIGAGGSNNFIETPMGTRNYVLNGGNYTTTVGWWGSNSNVTYSYDNTNQAQKWVINTATSAIHYGVNLSSDATKIPTGAVCTLTITYSMSGAGSATAGWQIQGSTNIPIINTADTAGAMRTVSTQFTVPSNLTGINQIWWSTTGLPSSTVIEIQSLKFEVGSTSSPWTPAPEDSSSPINQGFYLQNGTPYVASVYAKSPKGSNNLGITLEGTKIDYQEQPVASGWARISWTFTGDSGTQTLQNFRFESSTASSSNPVYITLPQIEQGTTLSPWSAYPGEETGGTHMSSIVASGQITIVDLNDAQSLTSYITTTSPRIQIYDSYHNTYTPDWSVTATNAVLVPNLYLTGSNSPIIGNAKSVAWTVDGVAITSGSGGYTIAASNAANPYQLTIASNVLSTSNTQNTYTCTIVWTDPNFNVDVTSICTFDFSLAQNGTGGVSSVLTNDSSIIATLADGTGGTYSGANCQSTAKIYVGGTDDTANWTFSQALSGCTATASGSPANSSVTVTNMTSDSATVTFTATRTGYPTQTLQFSLAKSKQGATPTSYWLVMDTSTFQKSAAGVLNPASVNLTGKSQVGTNAPANYTGRFIIEESTNSGGAYTTKYTSAADEATKNYVPSGNTVTNIRVSLYQSGGTSVLLDQQIINTVSDGINIFSAFLSNDSATIATDQNGANGVYTSTGTDIHVYDGATELTYDGIGTSNGKYKVTAAGTSITAGSIAANGIYATAAVASNVTADQASIAYTITGKSNSGAAINITKTQTFSRAKTGVAPTSYWQVLDNSAIKKSIAGAYTPTSYNITGKSQTGSATPVNQNCRIKIEYSTNSGGTYTVSASATYNASADTTTWPLNVPMTDAPAGVTNIRVSMYQAGGTTTLLDQDVINIVADGATGASTILANVYAPSGAVVRNNSGTITAECDLYVGSTVTTTGVTYQWYKYVVGQADQGGGANWLKLASGSDGGGTTGWTGNVLTIPASAIASMDTYKCIATYNAATYAGMLTVQDQSDPIQLVLLPDSGGNVFKNGQGTTKNITCKVYQAGAEIDPGGSIYTYEWTMTNSDGTLNTNWVDYVIANPTTAITFSTATTGGTIPASATYYYRYTWVTAYGETQPTTTQSYTTGSGTSTNTVTVTVPALPSHVTKTNIYVGTASGSEKLQGSTTSTTFTLTAAPNTGAAAFPGSNTASATMKTGKTVTCGPNDVTNIGNINCSIYQ